MNLATVAVCALVVASAFGSFITVPGLSFISTGGIVGGQLSNGDLVYFFSDSGQRLQFGRCPSGSSCGAPVAIDNVNTECGPLEEVKGFVSGDKAFLNFYCLTFSSDRYVACTGLDSTVVCSNESPTGFDPSLGGQLVMAKGSASGDVVVRVGVDPAGSGLNVFVSLLESASPYTSLLVVPSAFAPNAITGQPSLAWDAATGKVSVVGVDNSMTLYRMECTIGASNAITCDTAAPIDSAQPGILVQNPASTPDLDATGFGAAYDFATSTHFVPLCDATTSENVLLVCVGSSCTLKPITGATLCFMNNPSVLYVASADTLFISGSHQHNAALIKCTTPATNPTCMFEYETLSPPPPSPVYNYRTGIAHDAASCTVYGFSYQGIYVGTHTGCEASPSPPPPPPPMDNSGRSALTPGSNDGRNRIVGGIIGGVLGTVLVAFVVIAVVLIVQGRLAASAAKGVVKKGSKKGSKKPEKDASDTETETETEVSASGSQSA